VENGGDDSHGPPQLLPSTLVGAVERPAATRGRYVPAVIKLTFCLHRREGMTRAEFQTYWRETHAPLVASVAETLNIRRYVQTHTVDDAINDPIRASRNAPEPYDGVAELWWPSEDALRETGTSKAGRRAGTDLLADEAEFIDLAASPLWLAHEYPQVNPTPETIVALAASRIVKLHFALRQPEAMSMDDAQRYWRDQHGPFIRSMAPAMGMLRYQQVHRYETSLEGALRALRGTEVEAYTGHAEAWFERGALPPEAADAGRRAIEDERAFIDFARSAIWIGKEHAFVDRI
jgi:uncharacterized protein (TIGR02118 family)